MGSRRVTGKVAVVTGAARGQGAAMAEALAAEGATVVGVDVLDAERPLPGVTARRLDVTSSVEWQQLAAWLEAEHERVDVLVNNAGIGVMGTVADVTPANWDAAFDVNVRGPLLGMQRLLPLMGSGASIVNVASFAALTGHFTAAYTASKWALRGLSRAASNELGPPGIRVNTIFPGFIDTPMSAGMGPVFRDLTVREVPLGRVGTVDDVAPLVVFLAADESAYISGAEISVDGGEWAQGGTKSFWDAARAMTEVAR